MSMAKAMKYYTSKGNIMLKGSEETSRFVEFWNNLFDNFNRNLPWQGIKLDDNGFQVNNIIFIFYIKYFIMNINT